MNNDNQPELRPTYLPDGDYSPVGARGVFAPECILDHKYYLEEFKDYYFIVRKQTYTNNPDEERVCLYQQNVVNQYLTGDTKPFDLLVSNEERANRKIETIFMNITAKVSGIIVSTIIRKSR